LQRGADDVTAQAIAETKWIVTRSAPATAPTSISEWWLGVGESSVLALALQHPGTEVLIDDLAASARHH
jgi:predicted nucleic acid-binding protein